MFDSAASERVTYLDPNRPGPADVCLRKSQLDLLTGAGLEFAVSKALF